VRVCENLERENMYGSIRKLPWVSQQDTPWLFVCSRIVSSKIDLGSVGVTLFGCEKINLVVALEVWHGHYRGLLVLQERECQQEREVRFLVVKTRLQWLLDRLLHYLCTVFCVPTSNTYLIVAPNSLLLVTVAVAVILLLSLRRVLLDVFCPMPLRKNLPLARYSSRMKRPARD